MAATLMQRAAGVLAGSPLLRRGRDLYAENVRNWNFPLSKAGKLQAGLWLILDDYAKGFFPPKFPDRQKTYQAERDYHSSIPGMSEAEVRQNNRTKPFWPGESGRRYLGHFIKLAEDLARVQKNPPAKVLELGCGVGWMAEFLAATGYEVVGTTISEIDIADANRRAASLETKGLTPKLKFMAAPMESVHTVAGTETYDAAFVYEALHHAFDWRETLRSSFACLKPGGWLLICNEPNVLHTFIAYRVAKLSNTHEIGFNKGELIAELKKTGFKQVISTGATWHWWLHEHWLLAQK
ncbi:MAG TPA: class I SAM-dependent methyltransferase [Candidatus Sulfotelmatobacter sp.]|jgi:2-polyprenyl-3-methyl-5-hydroxy-6-metoxy-1,4-benzoquinol methylase|nr:class I SAM-dependent methyltransferase [Candidatus Sulfotelmatobacter sp.]